LKNIKNKIVAGFIVALIVALALGMPLFAQNLSKKIEVFYRDIKIYVDGKLMVSQDASGRVIEPFIYEGATYLPLRAVSEALGKKVDWNGVTNSVYIGEKPALEISEVTVSTAEEFIAALGSNKRILLEEGVYNLTKVKPSVVNDPSVSFKEAYDGPELVLNGVHNLSIQGVGEKQSEIIIEPRYAYVTRFINCSGVSIANVKAGHTEEGYCEGGVFSFENSAGIKIDNAQMYGCGTYGLNLVKTSDVTVSGSSVYGCTYGILVIESSSDILFKDCVFRDNEAFTMVSLGFSYNVTIDSCAFMRNTNYDLNYPDPMFSVYKSDNFVIKNTSFTDNAIKIFCDPKDMKFDPSNTFKNNAFDKAR